MNIDLDNTRAIFDEYVKYNKHAVNHRVATAINYIKKHTGISGKLTKDKLELVDGIMMELTYDDKKMSDKHSIDYQKTMAALFRDVITTLTDYPFKSKFSKNKFRYINHKNYHIHRDNEDVRVVIDEFIVKSEKAKLKQATISPNVNILIKCLDGLFGKIRDKTITREELLHVIQKAENDSPVDVTTKTIDGSSIVLSNACRHLCCAVNQLIVFMLDLQKISPREIISKNKNITLTGRDYFTDEELDKLPQFYKDDRERLIFAMFLTTGVRVGGLLNTRVKNVYNSDLTVKEEGETLEKKGEKIRRFPIYLPLKQALEAYRDGDYSSVLDNENNYIFPVYNKKYKSYKIPSSTTVPPSDSIDNLIKAVCKRAGIEGPHVHCHALRKTVTTKLMSAGNTLDHVSKFLGHSCSSITAKHYWVPTQEDLVKNMNMSWLLGNGCANGTSTISSDQTTVMQQFASHIFEGMKAKKQLEQLISLSSSNTLKKLDMMWTQEVSDDVFSQTRAILANITNMSTTATSVTD